jgi:hypothetical protein
MTCEIIDGKLVVTAGTPTEQWALDQFINGPAHWNLKNYVANRARAVAEDE